MSDVVGAAEVVGAVDCGTNSIRLLIAQRENGTLTDIRREMRVVRLGQGVDATGRLAPEALERTRAALTEYVQFMKEAGVQRVRMVATSATRDASNKDEFFSMTGQLLGEVSPGARAEVISGDEEARLSFGGAIGDVRGPGPLLVVDLGGGSTELVLGDTTGTVVAAYSADVGCVRITERDLPSDPPTSEEVARARASVREGLAPALAAVPIAQARTWIGVAGTMTTLSAVAQGLDVYDPNRIHMSQIPVAELATVCERLVGMSRDERSALGPMHPGRVDVIGGGALVTLGLIDALTAAGSPIDQLVVSEHDILDGIAQSAR